MSVSLNKNHLRVYKDVATLFLKYAPRAVGSDSFEDPTLGFSISSDEKVEPSEDAEEFARDLEKRGPAFVKLGQILSTRADLFPPEWLAALQRLQDQCEPFSFEEVRESVEEELGVRLSKAFETIDHEPLASASLGQVHRAVLRDGGTQVAVKVQRPDIRKRMLEDLAGLEEIADFLEHRSDFAKKYRFATIVSEFRKHVLSELDYLKEAQNLTRLRANLKSFRELIVPAPVDDYCSSRILTMEFVDGSRITDLSGAVRVELDGEKLAAELFRAYLQQVLVDGFFHADPHPGNILLTRDRRVALIDLGMVGHVSERLRDQLLHLLTAVSENRSSDAANVAIKAGRPGPDFNRAAFEEDLAEMIHAGNNASVEDIKVGSLVMNITQVCGNHGIIMPQEMYMLGKMLLNLDMVGEALDPTFDPNAAIRANASDLTQKRMRDSLTSGSLFGLLTEAKELFAETPQRINRTLENLANNKIRVKVDTIDETALLQGFQKIANRITVGVILGAIIIGAAMMMHIEANFTLFGYPGIAMVFFLLAGGGGLGLTWNILFRDEK